jgi:tetratricopeptide (TPR) repeat protein
LDGRGAILARFFMEIWEQATQLHLERRFDEAEPLYDQLLTQNHGNPGLLATLGTLYLQKQKIGLAICLLEASLKYGGPRQSDLLSNLGLAYKFSGQLDKARKFFEESVKKDPTGEALANYSALFIEAGQDEKCREICKRAIDLSPEHPIAHWNLSLTLLADGQWDTAWDEHEWGLVGNVMRKDRDLGGVPLWDGSPGKRVVIYGEQGIGDEIMFASMIPDVLKTNDVIIESHKRLKTLFEKSFGVPVYGMREEKIPLWVGDEKFDARISIGSLGKFYRRSREAFPGTPYLKADPLPKGDKFRVGISWTGGGAKQGRVQKRSVPLSWWKSILNVRDVEFVSLQYTDCKEELDLMETLGYPIKVMDEYVKAEDYYETARLVKSCDLVISVCTSVIHLAGALGVPCWVLTPKNPAWRYQNQGGMPWYRSVRLYRQPGADQDSWRPVVERVGLDLEELVHGAQEAAA